jgi:hypothetical protein
MYNNLIFLRVQWEGVNFDKMHYNWRAPKLLVRPKKGPTMLKSGSS